MMKRDWTRSGIALGALCGGLMLTEIAGAQTDPDAPAASPEPATDAAPAEAAALPEEAPQAEPAVEPTEEASAETSVADELAVADALDQGQTESRDTQYLFLGARYRAVIIPTFVQQLFADGGESLLAHTPGLEFAIRKNQFEYNLFAQFGIYSAEDVPFKGSSDDNTAWEILDFDYNILTLGADFMWSTDDFAPGLSMTYGAGVGIGAVFGKLNRTQAYPDDPNDQGNPETYRRCEGVGVPRLPQTNTFCTDDNDHYNGYEEPSWADGGSSPLIFPWIAAQMGLRYKVHRNFVGRLELGIMPTGAFVGVGADYGL